MFTAAAISLAFFRNFCYFVAVFGRSTYASLSMLVKPGLNLAACISRAHPISVHVGALIFKKGGSTYNFSMFTGISSDTNSY